MFHPDDIQAVFRQEGKWPEGGASTVWPVIKAFADNGLTNVGFAHVTSSPPTPTLSIFAPYRRRQKTIKLKRGKNGNACEAPCKKTCLLPPTQKPDAPLLSPVVTAALKNIQKYQDRLSVFIPRCAPPLASCPQP